MSRHSGHEEPLVSHVDDDYDIHVHDMHEPRVGQRSGACSYVSYFFEALGDTGRVLFAFFLAVIIGAVFKAEEVEDDILYRIIELPGKVWLNGLKLCVLPLIAANMIVAVASMKNMPSGAELGVKTMIYYSVTTILGITVSLICVNAVIIPNMTNIDLSLLPDELEEREPAVKLDALDQVERIFTGMVPDNIVETAADDNLMGVICFSILVGVALQRPQSSTIYQFFKELGEVMMWAILKLVAFTPVGIFSLVLPKVAQIDVALIAEYLGLMLGTLVAGLAVHTFVSLPIMYYLATRKNAYRYYLNVAPAILVAMGTSSSAATLPSTTKCAVEKNGLNPVTANFVLPLGATINMDGTAIKYPVMVIWLGVAQGMTFSLLDQIVLGVLCVLTSMGSAPIPTAGLAMWVMVLEATGVPVNGLLGLLFSVEWLVDRLETVVNIMSDSIAAGIMDSLVPLKQGAKVPGVEDLLNLNQEETSSIEKGR